MIELLINGTQVYLSGDESIELKFQFKDVTQIGENKTSFSKSFKIPATKENFLIFNNLNLVNADRVYDVRKRVNATLKVDGLIVFEGYLKVNNIIINNIFEENISYYDVTIFNETANFLDSLNTQTKKVKDLDFSEFDHTLTLDNVVNSWDTSIVYNGGSKPFQKGFGYVYPMVDYGGISKNRSFEWNIEGFRPHIYLKTIFDKIFTESGKIYDSEFLNSDYFTSLIITPNSKGSNFDADTYNFKAKLTNTQTFTVGLYTNYLWANGVRIEFDNDSINGAFDNNNDYNNTLYQYETPQKINIQLSHTTKFNVNVAFLGSIDTALYPDSFIYFTTRILRNGQIVDTYTEKIYIENIGIVNNYTFTTNTGETFIDSQAFIANTGENYYIEFFCTRILNDTLTPNFLNNIISSATIDILPDSEFFSEVINQNFLEGNNIILKDYLPEWTQKEFIQQVFNMFNLCVEVDKTNTNKFYIEPFNDFFDFENVWILDSYDIRNAQNTPLAQLTNKNFKFSYTEDTSDIINLDYKNSIGKVYGEYNKEVQTDFNNGTKEIKLLSAPAPPVLDEGTNRVITSIYGYEENLKTIIDFTPRILFYNFITNSNTATYSIKTSTTNNIYNVLPYAGFFDNPYDLDQTLEFYYSEKQYINLNNQFTTNTLYNNFYKWQIDEISDKNATMLTIDAQLTVQDINTLDFRRVVFLENYYYYVNSVVYSPNNLTLARLELVKINNIQNRVVTPYKRRILSNLTPQQTLDPSLISINQNVNLFTPSNNQNTISNIKVSGKNNYISKYTQGGGVFGFNNFLNGDSNVLLGKENKVGSTDAENNLVIGFNNVLNSKNSLLIGQNITSDFETEGIFFGDNTYLRTTTQSIKVSNLLGLVSNPCNCGATNGLLTGTQGYELGGFLYRDTDIDLNGFSFSLSNTQSGFLYTENFTLTNDYFRGFYATAGGGTYNLISGQIKIGTDEHNYLGVLNNNTFKETVIESGIFNNFLNLSTQEQAILLKGGAISTGEDSTEFIISDNNIIARGKGTQSNIIEGRYWKGITPYNDEIVFKLTSQNLSFGHGATATGTNSYAFGRNVIASADNAHAGGNGGEAFIINQFDRGYAQIGTISNERVHTGTIVLVTTATNSNLYELNARGQELNLSGSDYLFLNINEVYHFDAYITGVITTNNANFGQIRTSKAEGTIKRLASGTTLVSNVTFTDRHLDTGSALGTCNINITADNVNNKLKIECQGINSEVVSWTAAINYTRVVFG